MNKDAIMALPCQRLGRKPPWKRGSGLGKRDEEGGQNQGQAGTEKREGREGRNDCLAGAEGRGEARRQEQGRGPPLQGGRRDLVRAVLSLRVGSRDRVTHPVPSSPVRPGIAAGGYG